MDHRFDNQENKFVIHLSGRLTYNDHDKMRLLISDAIRNDESRIIFDFGELEFIDSAGVGMILIALEEFNFRHKKLSLHNATGQVARVMSVAQLSKLVEIDE